MLTTLSKKPVSVCRPGSGQGRGTKPCYCILLSYGSLFSLSRFYTPSLHVGVYSLRPSSCYEFIVLASSLCMTLCGSLDPFLTMKVFSEIYPQILWLGCIGAKPWATESCIPYHRNAGRGLQRKMCLYCLCLCTFKQR